MTITMEDEARVRVHDDVRRLGFLAALESQTWQARSHVADALGTAEAVANRPAYAAWLRRRVALWAQVPMPTAAEAVATWPLACLPATCLDVLGPLEADLRELELASTGVAGGSRQHRRPATPPGMTGMTPGMTGMTAGMTGMTGTDLGGGGDPAFLAGAAYVVVTVAVDTALLARPAEELLARSSTPFGLRHLRRSVQLGAARGDLRRELTAWAARTGPEAADRAILSARYLMHCVDDAGTETAAQRGW